MDEHFGRVLEALKDQGLEEDTIVVFTSDHGEMMGSHGLMGKSVWYEESMVIPLMMRWPGKVRPGSDDLLIGTADLTASLLSLLGHDFPTEMQGNDYSRGMLGEKIDRPSSALYIESNPSWPEGGRRGVRTHRYTYVVQRSKDEDEIEILHDNQEDPYQMENVAGERAELVAEPRGEMAGWVRETEAPWGGE